MTTLITAAKETNSKAKRSKMTYLGLNFKVSKYSKNNYRTTFKLFCAKKGLKKPHIKKRQTFEKWKC